MGIKNLSDVPIWRSLVHMERKAAERADGAVGQQLASLDAGLRVMTMFTQVNSVNVTSVSRELGCSRSTAYRILNTLRNRGVVMLGPTGRGYYPGPILQELARPHGWGYEDELRIEPVLEDAVHRCRETVHVATLVGTQVLFIDGREADRAVRASLRPGYLRPAYAVSAGNLLLSELGDDVVRTLFPTPHLVKVTPWTIGSVPELLSELNAIRTAGIATNVQGVEPGLSGVAVKLPGRSWRERLALCATVPLERGSYEDLLRIRADLEMSARLFA